MIGSPSEVLDRFSGRTEVTVRVSGEAKVLEAGRGGTIIRVTVPIDVLEWFVDVLKDTTVVVQEWWDYEGYDDTPREELSQSMASDIEELVSKLLDGEVRLVAAKRTRVEALLSKLLGRDVRLLSPRRTLEWKNDGSWEQALPFS